jgi:hypothetical protein
VLEIKSKHGDFIPEISRNILGIQLHVHNQVTEAGNYVLYNGDSALIGLSFNYNRKESDMQFLSQNQLKENIELHNLSHFSILDIQHKSAAIIESQLTGSGKQM